MAAHTEVRDLVEGSVIHIADGQPIAVERLAEAVTVAETRAHGAQTALGLPVAAGNLFRRNCGPRRGRLVTVT
jgi:hypothetical protein